ncbi:cytochrome c oxidase assembly protein [Actinotalea solisilvae]|uniref:cytochrome c oxidase assembly protein n=1 Tax=Actinotalea solisilvae TaxID=2072922 RepID=UPI0018F154EA|nr:cytochrome c oxidase assembly protein [Actinotalea solisilvae]
MSDDPGVTGPVWLPTSPPSLETMLAPTLQPVPVLPALALTLLVLYLAGAVRLWSSGRRWSIGATIWFVLGCVVLAIVTGAGIEGYGLRLFSAFMFQQLTLMMLVPPLLVLGRPGTLLLRATPHHGLGRWILVAARRSLRSPVSRVALHPAVMVPLFLLAFYGLYLGELAVPLLRTWSGHLFLEVGFLVAGLLFTVPVLSADPLPIRQTHPGRLLDLVLEMPLHAFFGVIVMMATVPMVPLFAAPPAMWAIDPLRDQQVAGALAWSYGEAPGLLMLLLIASRWQRSDAARSIARDRQIDRDGGADAELEEYNEYLARLNGSAPPGGLPRVPEA